MQFSSKISFVSTLWSTDIFNADYVDMDSYYNLLKLFKWYF